MTQALVLGFHVLLFVATGVPVALALRASDGRWATFVADTFGAGLVTVTLSATMFAWLGVPGVVAVGVLWAGFLGWAIGRRARFPAFRVPRGSDWAIVISGVGLLVLAVLLRVRSVNFLPWVGDMGAYVNWANEFARTGHLAATWPPLFPSFLAISSRVFGDEATTSAIPLAGVVLILLVGRVLGQFGVGRWAILITCALLTVNLHAIWFSSFPGSESLNAPLFVAWVSTVVAAVRGSRRTLVPVLTAAACVMLALGLLRGTGPLLLLALIATAVVATTVASWRDLAPRLWLVSAASTLGAAVSYWYGIVQIPTYYIDTQVRDLVPEPVFGLIRATGLFSPTPLTAIVLAVVIVVIGWGGWWFSSRRTQVGASRVPARLAAILAGAFVVGIAADAVMNAEILHIFLRSGIWLLAACVVLVAVVTRVGLPAWVQLCVLWLGTTASIFFAIHSYRLKFERPHAFFLYWDRYIFSELIPLMFLLFGVLIWALWVGWGRERYAALRSSPSPARRVIAAAAGVVVLAAMVGPSAPLVRLAVSDSYMAGAWQFEQRLMAMLPDRDTPIAWSATTADRAPGFFFPNTWMAFAKPMVRSYGLEVVNLDGRGSDFAPDIVFTRAGLADELEQTRCGRLIVFETETGGTLLDERLGGQGFTFASLGSQTSDISLLSQPPENGGWTHARITVNAWSVTASGTPSACAG